MAEVVKVPQDDRAGCAKFGPSVLVVEGILGTDLNRSDEARDLKFH